MNKRQQEMVHKLQEAIEDHQAMERLNLILSRALSELEQVIVKRS